MSKVTLQDEVKLPCKTELTYLAGWSLSYLAGWREIALQDGVVTLQDGVELPCRMQ